MAGVAGARLPDAAEPKVDDQSRICPPAQEHVHRQPIEAGAMLGPVTHMPATQYADDSKLAARQRLWAHRTRPFDLYGWVLDLAGVRPGQAVLDVGCGNGPYLRALHERGVEAVGCDLSLGMVQTAPSTARRLNADVASLPLTDAPFDVVLAPHMLYHVPDQETAARELRRVLKPGGVCVAVTNGAGHLGRMRDLVEAAVAPVTSDWRMFSSMRTFSLENGTDQLHAGFDEVDVVRPSGVAPIRIDDPDVVADYLASVADLYQDEIDRPWADVVAEVRAAVQAVIDRDGLFTDAGDTGAFVCR